MVFRYEKCDLQNTIYTHSMDETKLRHFWEAIQLEKKQPLRQNGIMKKDHGGGSNFVKSANNSPNSSVDRKVCMAY